MGVGDVTLNKTLWTKTASTTTATTHDNPSEAVFIRRSERSSVELHGANAQDRTFAAVAAAVVVSGDDAVGAELGRNVVVEQKVVSYSGWGAFLAGDDVYGRVGGRHRHAVRRNAQHLNTVRAPPHLDEEV